MKQEKNRPFFVTIVKHDGIMYPCLSHEIVRSDNGSVRVGLLAQEAGETVEILMNNANRLMEKAKLLPEHSDIREIIPLIVGQN